MSTAKINNIDIGGLTTNLLETSLRTTFVKTFPSYVFNLLIKKATYYRHPIY